MCVYDCLSPPPPSKVEGVLTSIQWNIIKLLFLKAVSYVYSSLHLWSTVLKAGTAAVQDGIGCKEGSGKSELPYKTAIVVPQAELKKTYDTPQLPFFMTI